MFHSAQEERNEISRRYARTTKATPRFIPNCSLYIAPDIPTRRIVLSARAPQPTLTIPENSNEDMSWSTQQNPPRPSYPKEMLKHRFMPVGSLTPAPGQAHSDSMDVDQLTQTIVEASQELEVKTKKRKVEGSSKKSKKAKNAD